MAAEAAARGSVLVATLEQHVARAEAALRREEAAALRLRLELATLPPGEQEERLRSFLTSSDLGALEQLAAVSFLPSVGTLHLGVLLTSTSGTIAAPPEHRVAVVTEVKEEGVTEVLGRCDVCLRSIDSCNGDCEKKTERKSKRKRELELNREIEEIMNVKTRGSVAACPVTRWTAGAACVARWPEDGVWYRAEVLEVLAQAFLIIFIDYGNTAEVGEDDMVATVEEVPAEEREMVDELAMSGGVVEEHVEDEVPKKSSLAEEVAEKVVEQMPPLGVTKETREEGQEAAVASSDKKKTANMLDQKKEINKADKKKTMEKTPIKELVEKEKEKKKDSDKKVEKSKPVFHVAEKRVAVVRQPRGAGEGRGFLGREEQRAGDKPKDTNVKSDITNKPDKVEKEVKSRTEKKAKDAGIKEVDDEDSPAVELGALCVARWGEDGVWYRAQVTEVAATQAQVIFLDYGNSAWVGRAEMVGGAEGVPEGEELDQFVQGKGGVVEEHVAVGAKGLGVGQRCLAQYSEDLLWYNAEVLELLPAACLVLFTDYGNQEEVGEGRVVLAATELPAGAVLDQFVAGPGEEAVPCAADDCREVKEEPREVGRACTDGEPSLDEEELPEGEEDKVGEGARCLAVWGEDGVLYRAQLLFWHPCATRADVLFVDYDNVAVVSREAVFRSYAAVPEELRRPELVDQHVNTTAGFSLVAAAAAGGGRVAAKLLWTVAGLEGRVELALTTDSMVVAAICQQEAVRVFGAAGEQVVELAPVRPFQGLSGVAVLDTGHIAALDRRGVQLFAASLAWEREVEVRGLATPGGLCQGEGSELVLVNRCLRGDRAGVTEPGETDLLYVDRQTGRITRRIEMVDILGDDSVDSACHHITYQVAKHLQHLACHQLQLSSLFREVYKNRILPSFTLFHFAVDRPATLAAESREPGSQEGCLLAGRF